jgi:phosphatidylserine/phosphatidylglycerophosphate/cardiolipin synthase-like enzyme
MIRQHGRCILSGFVLLFSTWASAFPLEVAEAPTTTLPLTVGAIKGAQRSILLNIYEFSSVDIAEALLERIRAGVHVEIIQEGQPVGGMSAAARGIQAQIAKAMRRAGSDNHLYEMTSHAGDGNARASKRRYRFDHAKYAVIDGKSLLVGSENYSPTGHPRATTKGNRGWEVLVHEPDLAAAYAKTFRTDADMAAGDLIDMTVEDDRTARGSLDWLWSPPLSADLSDFAFILYQGEPEAALPGPVDPYAQPTLLEASEVLKITSPDNSLPGLLDLINSAQKSLDVEQMTFDSEWGKGKKSPILQAVLAAARRGVVVRILLNDERVFGGHSNPPASKNLPTIKLLNRAADREDLDLEARTADIKAMGVTYIHNKGALVDGDKTLVSSINWGPNAVLNNREAAVLLTSSSVNRHYARLFESDWKHSEPEKDQVQHGTGSESPLNLDINSEICPERLRITVEIGRLRIPDPDDVAFEAISDTVFVSDFVRTSGTHTCMLTDIQLDSETGKARFIQIRKKPNGLRSAALEGYTPEGKVYSIRTTFDTEGPYDGDYSALVYDGSSPSRQKLGSAVMTVETQIER